MNEHEVEQAVRMARALAAEHLSWFSPALFSARLVLTEACPWLAAIDDHMRVYFNPTLVEALLADQGPQRGLVQLAWVWTHEISHALRDHGQRARERHATPLRWNVAADLEINDAQWENLEPPRQFQPLLPHVFHLPKDRLAELYYDRLPAEETIVVRLSSWAPGSKQQPWSPGSGNWQLNEGSGVHGHRCPWELDAEHDQAPAVSPLEQEVIRQRVAEAISALKDQGDLPGGWLRWAKQSLQPSVNWRAQLQRRVRGAVTVGVGGRLDYSFQRPHRRASLYAPLIRPSLHGDRLPRVACVVDTSGSMSQHDLSQCMAELRSVLDTLRTPITVIPCDAEAYEPVELLTRSDYLHLERHLQGGGGTDMLAGIRAALNLKRPPDTIIVLTDGYTPFPKRRYSTPVIFGILKPSDETYVPKPPMPPWRPNDVIIIKSDGD